MQHKRAVTRVPHGDRGCEEGSRPLGQSDNEQVHGSLVTLWVLFS